MAEPARHASAELASEWLSELREEAAAKAASLPLPTRRDRRWEFTDLSGLDEAAFSPAGHGSAEALGRADSYLPPVEGALRIDQVDATALSLGADGASPAPVGVDDDAPVAQSGGGAQPPGAADGEPAGPIVMSLGEATVRFPELVRAHFGRIVAADDHFSARNAAEWVGGAFVYVPANVRLEQPVQLTCVQDDEQSALAWRTLIVLEEGAEAEVWERHLSGAEDTEGLFTTTVEIAVGQNARLSYVCGQDLSEKTWVFGSHRAVVERDGSLDWVALGLGSGHGKVRMETKLAGRGAEARVTGAYASRHDQHLDFDTNQIHAAPDCNSDLAFRGILGDTSTAVWWGMIVVEPGAQNTDAFQESRNLLVSTDAHADAIPGLEIQADDVRCTHAAAIAQVDTEQLFYLQSRGLGVAAAKRLVIEGFLQAIVERVHAGPVRDAVSGALAQRLDEVLGAATLDRAAA